MQIMRIKPIILKIVLITTLCYATGTNSIAQPSKFSSSDIITLKTETVIPSRFTSRDQFIKALLPHAVKAGKQLGVDPKVILAQAALESNWGKSILKHADKRLSHNIFCIEYTPGRGEKSLTVRTKEFKNGKPLYKHRKFKSYNNFGEAFEDYTRIIQKPHYKKHMKNLQSPSDYATGLQRAGYATDPKYAKKIMKTYHDPILKDIEY